MEAAEVAFPPATWSQRLARLRGAASRAFRASPSHCDYETPARFDDILDIDVKLERLGTKSVTYTFVFTRGADIIARGSMTSVCCRAGKDGRLEPIEIPEGIRAKLMAK